MSVRNIIIGILIFCTLVIPIVQLGFGFHYVTQTDSCKLQPDLMLLMAIGGVFQAIFYAATFAFLCKITPSKYKKEKVKSVAQASAKGSNRASNILIGCITSILGACAIIFFVLIQIRVYRNIGKAQWTDPTKTDYCLFTIYSSAFGLMIATYVAFLLIVLVAFILLCGIGAGKQK